MSTTAPVRTPGSATAALVLGIVTLVIPFVGFVTGPLGIVLARKGKGHGQATAGLVCSIIGTVGYALATVFFVIVAASSGS
ncbi:hypothetical protein [Kitasatospora sp. McL0602]|uniref:hypothetical protein n=1 Tax=Kitasatospora sp. McL0602 TaxID=3439530 RepID=UPI003F8B72A3